MDASDDGRHTTAAQPNPWPDHLHEHFLSRRQRPAALQISGYRLADIDRQRQMVHPGSLAMHREQPGAPVDVLQPQRGDLPGAQPEPQHHHDHRVVATPGRAAPIAGAQQRPRLRRANALRQ
jgi:hypothetical protein